jgi:amphiphysin
VADYLKAGGVQADVKDLSSLQKGLAIATGKALPSDFAKTGAQSGATPAAPAPVATPVTSNASPTSSLPPSNPFESPVKSAVESGGAKLAGAPPPPPPPPGPPAGGPKKHLVVGLYDHEPDADDELPFLAGDTIEVIDSSDEGWWKGRCNGKEGLFPTNYVQEKK